ncbi:Kinesin-2 [Tetrabaena socialis]|uniref:Kinesin-2 n=1 Tax=Tetrabaena socialis TaxID=47790 RepID=A0A2J7ZZW2_9CHLO|nr:Kinesin-2 [Tetrabaena socialis]|eukprot:PNH05811.1 Kinesin-2 [Tetrabaena socialis]
MEDRQPDSRPQHSLGVHDANAGEVSRNRPPLPGAPAVKVGASAASADGAKENAQAHPGGATAHIRSEYVASKLPAKSSLRKADDPLWSKFSSLQDELLNFSTQTQARRDSLTERAGSLNPVLLPLPLLAAAQRPTDPSAAPPWASVHRTLPESKQQSTLGADAASSQEDDGCTTNLGSHTSGSKEKLIIIPAGATASSKIAKAAVEAFDEPGLQKLWHEGLHKQLQRTKDGATDKSRIHELAELVKLLRKCIKEMGSRTTLYIDQCIKLERENSQQVESVKLSTHTTLKQLEAELASTRQSLAECELDFRNDKAKWGFDLETQRAEASRLMRELERLTEERDRARDEAKRAEQQRQQLDAELKARQAGHDKEGACMGYGRSPLLQSRWHLLSAVRLQELRKAASQQMREVSANQGEAVRALTEEKFAADNRIHGLRVSRPSTCVHLRIAPLTCAARDPPASALSAGPGSSATAAYPCPPPHPPSPLAQDENVKLSSTLKAAQDCVTEYEREVQLLRATVDNLRGSLAGKEAASAVQSEQVAKVHRELAQCREQLAALTGEAQRLQQELERGGEERAELAASLERTSCEVSAQRARLAEAEQEAEEQRGAWEVERQELVSSLSAVTAEKSSLCEGMAYLKAALAAAMGQKEEAAASAAREAAEKGALLRERTNLQHQARTANAPAALVVEMAASCQAQAEQAAASARAQAEAVQAEMLASQQQLADKDGRLAHLEGEFEALKEVLGETAAAGGDGGGGKDVVTTLLSKIATLQNAAAAAEAVRRKLHNELVDIRGNILATARKLEEQAEWSYSMEASFVEIYNNQLRDLLGSGPAGASPINDLHAIKHDPDGGHTLVAGVSKVPVSDAEGAGVLIRRASAARAVEATAMNSVSSRSHSVFMLYITGWHAGSGTRLQGCLCLVDLAGSERLDRSLAEGQAKKEACAINQSLSSLGDVFAALSSKSSHVPYRNSKLTYLLQPCLGGSGKTLMFVNINPEPASAGESLCSLRFASKVSGCETGAKGGARRNMLTLGGGGGEAGPSAGSDAAARPPTAAGSGAPPTGRRPPAAAAPVASTPAASRAAAPPEALPGSLRASASGLPRPPPGGLDALAAKRMSLAPQRGTMDGGAARMSLAGQPGRQGHQQAEGSAGAKRAAPGPAGNAAKRSKV